MVADDDRDDAPGRRTRRLALHADDGRGTTSPSALLFVGGYLAVWAAAGIPAYVALRIIDDHVGDETMLRVVAVVILAAAGIYQLTPLKAVCLRHCRSPLGQLLHYGNIKGRET